MSYAPYTYISIISAEQQCNCVLSGPWYIGPLARDEFGAVFMWGIFVESSTLPGELTYPDAYFLVRDS